MADSNTATIKPSTELQRIIETSFPVPTCRYERLILIAAIFWLLQNPSYQIMK